MSSEDREGTWWYCEEHHRAERFADCNSDRRIGPFATEAQADRALQTIAERERHYDAEDDAWNSAGPSAPPTSGTEG
ncbi:hypothetical protein M6D93_13410 [Jatrophihabitans telluris]|uniref:SPOR domain-containing protein n=1 Tax=Jatrophihabitans telluris TaxID=2038343 RepID=A0ABY4QUZ9_9ACTN|nr:hypothetical protein [Jatrophihabitans telluris]UQX87295.1 hypothetical protein M6D93_13410 [Jatrophihabitans telluris]